MSSSSITTKSTNESTDKLTELIWQDALRHLESTNNEVLLPVNITDMIGQSNIDKIKARLCALIDAPVVAFVDESINALRVMRTPAFSGSAVSVASHERISNMDNYTPESARRLHGKSSAPPKVVKVPRPPNAFILYRQHHHPRIKEAYPHLSNNEICKQWKAEVDETKVHFRNLAEELKKKHAEDHPDYHYSPRKPSEKKRRASTRQPRKAAQNLESPASTNGTSTASTPAMQSGMQVEDPAIADSVCDPSSFNMVFSPSNVPDEQLNFDSDAFDSLIQQVQDDYSKTMVYTQFGYPDVPVGDSFEFSEFMTNDL